jgi:hypothetical protein
MIDQLLKVVGIVGMIVISGVFAFVLAYSTIKTWWDSPLFNLAFWTVIGLVVLLLGWPKKKGST